MIPLQPPHFQNHLDSAMALLGFCQKQWIRWAEINLSHHRLGMITSQEKLTQITQSKDPFRAQLTSMQMASEQLSNNIQWGQHLWASCFESQSQWNQSWLHLLQAQQQVVNEAIQFQWLAAQPPSEYANAMAESVMAVSRHFVNGAGTSQEHRSQTRA